MKKISKKIKQSKTFLQKQFTQELSSQIIIDANLEYNKLIVDNRKETKEIKKISFNDIYPCIALYRSLLKNNISKNDAVNFLDSTWSELAKPKAKQMQLLCKFPGMYKMMPRIFKQVAKKQFGEKQGFKANFYDTEKGVCKFDMTQCLYCNLCRKNNCEELIVCFCHTDDITNSNIHKNLCWERTKTMGEGYDLCDFNLHIKN